VRLVIRLITKRREHLDANEALGEALRRYIDLNGVRGTEVFCRTALRIACDQGLGRR
jgi:hypothetical protein